MMTTPCDLVAERIALGEALGDVAEHAATCARCKRLVALPVELGALRRDPDPGIGFAARITVGAQHRITVRRHRRIAGGAALAVVAAAAVMFAVTRTPDHPVIATTPIIEDGRPALAPQKHDPWEPRRVDADVMALVHLANVERSSHLSAHWGHIEKPLAPYRALLKGSQP